MERILGVDTLEIREGKTDLLVRVKDEEVVLSLNPNFRLMSDLGGHRGILVTAEGTDCDFVSRCFFPQSGIDEDPATGSAHCTLTTYWSEKLGKTEFKARQLSSRGASLECILNNDRVELKGRSQLYMIGTIFV
jgi:predicted PhzF superfamily epimerase YddE/YHI9